MMINKLEDHIIFMARDIDIGYLSVCPMLALYRFEILTVVHVVKVFLIW